VDTERIDVRREPLVVRDGCAPGRIPAGRWPSDEVLVRSEQFAVNEAIACLAEDHEGRGGPEEDGAQGDDGLDDGAHGDGAHEDGGREGSDSADWVFGLHAPPGTGVTEVFGDLVAAIVTERARRIAELDDPSAAFGETRAWGAHTVSEPAPGLTGFEIVLTAPEAVDGLVRPGPGLPPIGAAWRDRAARADYFASTARLADGIGAWAMLAARLGDQAVNRAFADRWWHGAVRGADVLFPAGESMAAALRRLKDTAVYWPACVAWFRSALAKVQRLAEERMEVAAALSRLSLLEQACEEAAQSAEMARARLADLVTREPAARDAVTLAEEEYRAVLAALGAHELSRPQLAAVTRQGIAALRSRRALLVALAGGARRGRNLRGWSIARRELREACVTAERRLKDALRAAGTLRANVEAARSALDDRAARLSRLTMEMEPLAATVTAARKQWGDSVPVGPSQAETEDPVLIEWRETSAPWADEEYARARAEAFIAALELHKALIIAQADTFEANLAALTELISTDTDPADDAEGGLAEARRAAWQSFFLVVPVVRLPFEAAGPLFGGFTPGTLGWLLTAGSDQLAAEDVPGLLQLFGRAVFAGDTVLAAPRPEIAATVGIPVPAQPTAQDLADRVVRYGTWLPAGRCCEPRDDTGPRWVGIPLRVVRGQDRTTVDRRNDLAYDGLLITGQD
jgi:hypothetical protein